ncbi:MAG: hypothetical protein LBU04_08060, partial [Christensenellaceae bacterium]|nr:hypothetical protein [Christensenellaceae bacterium]
SMRKIEYDVYGFFKLLVFGRILHPASKISTVEQNNDYYDPIISDYNPFKVYDTLDFIADNKDKLIKRINSSLVEKAGRSPDRGGRLFTHKVKKRDRKNLRSLFCYSFCYLSFPSFFLFAWRINLWILKAVVILLSWC